MQDRLPRDGRLATYRELFRELPAVPREELCGRYEALVIGRAWYRAAFRVLLAIGGLRGWAGKEFSSDGTGANLCRRGARVERRSRLRVAGLVPSELDGRPALLLRYSDRSPLRLVHDELRRHRDGTCLGLTYVGVGPLRRVRLPFAIRPVAPRPSRDDAGTGTGRGR